MSEGVRDLWGQQPKVVAGSVLLADHAGRGASERRGVNENREAGGDTLCGPPVARLAGRFQARFLVRFLGRVTPRLAPLLLLPLLLCPLGGAAADDLLERLTAAEGLEKYLHTRYVGQKRFSLEGGDSLIPLLHETMLYAGTHEVEEMLLRLGEVGDVDVLG